MKTSNKVSKADKQAIACLHFFNKKGTRCGKHITNLIQIQKECGNHLQNYFLMLLSKCNKFIGGNIKLIRWLIFEAAFLYLIRKVIYGRIKKSKSSIYWRRNSREN